MFDRSPYAVGQAMFLGINVRKPLETLAICNRNHESTEVQRVLGVLREGFLTREKLKQNGRC